MTMNNHFVELWHKLEEQHKQGIVKIAYSETIPYRIYATMSCPGNICGIAISFNNTIKVELKHLQNLRQLSVQLVSDTSYQDSSLLLVQLLSNENQDVFATLCENLVNAATMVSDERVMVKMVITKLHEWKALFDKLANGVLTKPQQIGLFGELYFLKQLLINKTSAAENEIVATWQGMEKEHAVRDFQGGNWIVEVKTTTTNRPQKVLINGERQLDDTLVDNLFLFHCSVDISNASGVTLPDMIADIRSLLTNAFMARSLFEEKLYHTGYQDKDVEHYSNAHYLIRSDKFYKIEGAFPRICENKLRPGVGEVHYSVVLAACGEYIVSNTYAFSIINNI